ncbi:MAG TPA: TIM-barrel domain-containing protein [Bacteroidota bacterium]|nr:TIM-barrel domain-containing protein [Bacteroidota bacterium]
MIALRTSISILLLSLACSLSFPYEKQPDGIVFALATQNPTGPKLVKVQICTEDIIRILATRDSTFSSRDDLVAERHTWEPVPWSVREDEGLVEVSTSKLIVRVDPANGALTFLDSRGRLLLEEPAGGGKIITPAAVMGENTFHIQQLFNSPPEEAFYGLGGNQNAIMNFKGHDIDLYQKNMVEVVPFLVSSHRYGILWANTSHTKFGDPREFNPISSLELIGSDGTEGGLTAEYFGDTTFGSLVTARRESTIDHEYLDIHDQFPEGFAEKVKAVRWSGSIATPVGGKYTLRLCCSGYTRLWIDGRLAVESWRQNWLPWTHFVNLEMQQGVRHRVKLEWIHGGGGLSLRCVGPADPLYQKSLSLYSEVADQIEYYFVRGDDLDRVIHGYRLITGKAPMMPSWALGLWQSRQHYASQDEILSVVDGFRTRRIPIDNIVQDWFYWKEDKWGDHEFDSSRYPDPAAMIRTLHNELHAHFMISVWAKFYVGTKNFDEFQRRGWLYMRNVEKSQRDWVGPGYVSTFYDPYAAGARALFWKQMNEKLFSKGVDAWWLDCTEPDIQSNLSREETILRQGPTALGSASRYLNSYSLMQTRAVYEGQRSVSPDQRVFILTRSAFAGTQRYAAATWSGDLASRWYDMKAQISGGMNFSLSGVPYWTMDIGGFAVEERYLHPSTADLEEWRELNTRWFQFGAFCPLFRVHGEAPYREMFNIAPAEHPAYQAMLHYDQLRYRLMPYLYSIAGMVTQQDYTIMRAMVMDFPEDTNVFGIGDQFLLGPSLLVSPVTEFKARSRSVYLPATGWYELWSGKYFPGGGTIRAEAPYSDIPLLVREGSIIPCGPDLQYTGEKPADPIRLFVYTGKDASFTLYEDEGVNYDYEKGLFTTIEITYNEHSHTLNIGPRRGTYPGMLLSRTFEIVWIGPARPSAFAFSSRPDALLHYDGLPLSVTMNVGAK